MKPFSQLIREKRKEKGYSMDKLCRIVQEEEGLKMSKSLLNFLEKGRRMPTYEVAYAISRALELDTNESISLAYESRRIHSEERELASLEKFLNKKGLKRQTP
jgi:transcriptional regulator with XRE-family HTH domain